MLVDVVVRAEREEPFVRLHNELHKAPLTSGTRRWDGAASEAQASKSSQQRSISGFLSLWNHDKPQFFHFL